jgi:hypothetical protein
MLAERALSIDTFSKNLKLLGVGALFHLRMRFRS